MLSMGSSKPWPDALEVLTGTRKMDAGAILEYFKPLEDWLVTRNKELNVHIGWDKSYRKYEIFANRFAQSFIFILFSHFLYMLQVVVNRQYLKRYS